MSPADAGKLLALCAAYDNRKPDSSGMAAAAWADALGDLPFEDCVTAIRKHYRDTDRYLMPAHVRMGVERIRELRAAAKRAVEGPQSRANEQDGVPMPDYVRAILEDFAERRKIPEEN